MDTDTLYEKYKDPKYLEFSKKLSPTDTLPRAGIRIPNLRTIAKTIKPEEIDIKYHEDVILKGLAIANEKIPFEDKARKLNELLPYLST